MFHLASGSPSRVSTFFGRLYHHGRWKGGYEVLFFPTEKVNEYRYYRRERVIENFTFLLRMLKSESIV